MKRFKRIFLIVCDSVGMGGAPDAEAFGDLGADTLGHIDETVECLDLPNLQKLGLGSLKPLRHVAPAGKPLGYYCSLREESQGKDTMTGHWEMMGLYTEKPFITFTETGFPDELIRLLEERCGKKVVGNIASSGTEILDMYGEEEIRDGKMIVYTSADSVLQICGNEETFDLENLYRCCEIARELTLRDEWKVGRVIARPYVGKRRGEFVRTANRRDYALKPFGRTALNVLKDAGLDVLAVGKINDIFSGEGITRAVHSDSSVQGMEQTIEMARDAAWRGLCFVNLVDFDAKWGHRRDPEGYAAELMRFDEKLGELLPLIEEDDLLMVTADHGNDPTWRGTDHTRERVPLLLFSPALAGCGPLPEQKNFGVLGASICENFGLEMPEETIGTSLLHMLD